MADFQIWRNTIYQRSWTYVWSSRVTLDPNGWALAGGRNLYQLTPISLGLRSLNSYDAGYHHALRIPNEVLSGTYDLRRSGASTGINVMIEDPPITSTPNVVVPSTAADAAPAIQAAVD